MKIAFDATVVHGRKSGVGYYSQELLRALVASRNGDEYFIFSHRPLSGGVVEPGPGVRFAGARFCPVRAVYLQALLPGLLDMEAPDLVHYTNFLAPFTERRPYVVTVHDMSLERLEGSHPVAKRLYTKRLIPRAIGGARLILTNSEFSKWDTVRFLGIPEDRIRVTPLAPSKIFRPLPPGERERVLRPYGLRRPYFLYVGNLEPRKNLERLLEAFSRVSGADHTLVIAGNDWFRGGRVAGKAAQLGLGRRVRFLGYVPRADLPGLMGSATAFVYPSLLEGFGLPVLEAMACGVPVITSRTSALGEVAGDAGFKVDPVNVDEIAGALRSVMEDAGLRAALSANGLARASGFSWAATARETRRAYEEALDRGRRSWAGTGQGSATGTPGRLLEAVPRTLQYAEGFDYPLTPAELRDRLFDVPATQEAVDAAVERLGIPVRDGYLLTRPELASLRRDREQWTKTVLAEFERDLEFLAAFPFVRMLAFSGATAHRNMSDRDLDLFAVVEDGKLWAVLAGVTLWAKMRGLRKNICLNYVLSDRALPLFETDAFTAQQAASLKPIYGKAVYDRFIRMNPFIGRHFPNFDPARHREQYPELRAPGMKGAAEFLLRLGPVQFAEWVGRTVWGRHLRRKRSAAEVPDDTDVLLERRRIKLHLRSHRQAALRELGTAAERSSPGQPAARAFAPSMARGREENAKIQDQ